MAFNGIPGGKLIEANSVIAVPFQFHIDISNVLHFTRYKMIELRGMTAIVRIHTL